VFILELKIKSRRAPWSLAHASGIVVLVIANVTYADDQDVVNFNLSHAVTYEDNLFRLDSNESPLSNFGKSQKWDVINATTYGVSVNKPYSLQRFKFDISQTSYRYQNYNFLNFDGINYDIQWNWALTPYLKGNLKFDRQERPNTFSDIGSINRLSTNTRTIKNNRFDIDWSAYHNWHLIGALAELTVSVDNASNNDQNLDFSFTQTSGIAGIRYEFPSGSSIDYMATHTNGQYQDSFFSEALLRDKGYQERRNDISLKWLLTGKSTVNAKIGYLKRENDNFSQRNVDGFVGNIDYDWDITGKTRLTFALSSNLYPIQSSTDSYIRDNTFAIRPIWAVSPKVALKGNVAFRKRIFEGSGPASSLVEREDKIRTTSVSLDWMPRRYLTLEMMLKRESRDTNITDFDYVSNSAMVSAVITF
jgi:exopolysaccharide biosynthesis operon protein EpsL